MRWRARRARGQTWFSTVVQTMCSINNPKTMKRLHISLGVNRNNTAEEIAILEQYAKLCIEISSARCWSQCQYTICLPNAFALVHHPESEERVRGMAYCKKIWESVLHAERILKDDTVPADVVDSLQKVMKDLAWNKGQVARELYVVCQAGGWNPTDEQTRTLGFYLFSTHANTKHFLEDCFSHLADVVKRIARHVKLSKNLKFADMYSFAWSRI